MLIVSFLFTTRLSSQIQVFNFFFSAKLRKPGIQLLNSKFVSDLEFSFSNPGLFEFQVWNKPGIEKLNSRFTLKSPLSHWIICFIFFLFLCCKVFASISTFWNGQFSFLPVCSTFQVEGSLRKLDTQRFEIYHCYQVKIWTVKKGSLCISWYIVDTLVTKLHFCIFSTEGVNKKPIRYWFFSWPLQY